MRAELLPFLVKQPSCRQSHSAVWNPRRGPLLAVWGLILVQSDSLPKTRIHRCRDERLPKGPRSRLAGSLDADTRSGSFCTKMTHYAAHLAANGGPVKKIFLGIAFICSLMLLTSAQAQTFDIN